MPLKNISGKNAKNTITSEDILGKRVLDIEGDFIGVVEKILIDKGNFNILAISVDKGFLRKGLTIGKGYIKRVTRHALFLKISVPYKLKNMTVFDNEGKEVGKVSSVELYGDQDRIKSIHLSRKLFSTSIKGLNIHEKFIKAVGENVLLNISREKLLELT